MTVLLVGCNNDNDNAVDDAARDVENGVDDIMGDVTPEVNDGVNDTDHNNGAASPGGMQNDTNGQINEGTVNPGEANGTGQDNSGITQPGVPADNNSEDLIEDEADRRDRDTIDNQ